VCNNLPAEWTSPDARHLLNEISKLFSLAQAMPCIECVAQNIDFSVSLHGRRSGYPIGTVADQITYVTVGHVLRMVSVGFCQDQNQNDFRGH